jgi:ribosome-associated protein
LRVKKEVKKIAESLDELKDVIITSIQDKQGEEIISMDLRAIEESVTDYFIICHASSTTQVKAIASHILEQVKELTGDTPWHKEGLINLEWVLIDYVNIVVHIFLKDMRTHYQIEDLWADAIVTKYDEDN